MQIRRQVPLIIACWLMVLGSLPLASPGGQAPPAKEQAPPAKEQAPPAKPAATPDQVDFGALVQLVDAVSGGQAPAAALEVKVGWLSNHFIRSQGDTVYIPFTVSVDRGPLTAPSVAMYIRAVRKDATAITLPGAKPSHPWETINFVDLPPDGRLSRAIALSPGTYDVFVGVKERGTPAPGRMGLARHELVVPALNLPDLTTSSVILARSLEQLSAPLPPEKQPENPYVYGTLKVNPSVDHVFARNGELHLLFWIYGASHTGGKPDVQVEFNFHQRMPDGTQKYFNKTAPQEMNEKTLPPEFNLTAGHQLLSTLAIPLASFPGGDYRLEIKVTDRPSGKSVTRDVDFQVSAS
jgi:hypothetical protein